MDDDDRWPWLDRVAQVLAGHAPVIVGCSALKRVYRDRIRAGAGAATFVHLAGSHALIAARMARRRGHYMPLTLLASQFAALEPPGADEGAIIVDIDQTLAAITAEILRRVAV